MRTITWDYDNNVVTEWCRMGGCNHCGECCEVTIYIDVCGATEEERRNGGNGVSEEGVWHEWDNGERRFWRVNNIAHDEPCTCFNDWKDDGGCQIETCKSLICTAWPLHPDHVNEFDNCSYRFVKLNEWELTDKKAVEEV